MFMFIKFYVYLISQYSEAGLIQKYKNSTHRVAMVSGDDGASTDRQSSSCSCASTRLVDRPVRRLVSRAGSVDWASATCRRPRVVVLNCVESTTAHCRSVPDLSPTTQCRSVPELSTTSCGRSDQRCRWTRAVKTTNRGVHVVEQRTGAEDTYRRRLRPMTVGVEANVHTVDALQVCNYGGWWWWLMGVTTNACYR